MDRQDIPCAFCGQPFLERELTRHHCKPRSRGGSHHDIALLCRQCHGMVHATYTNQTLSALYPTILKLRDAPELASFLKWVRKQPSSRRKVNKARTRKL
jgi:5-methylcytosine-specific restriction endonuclease McrA